MKKIIREWLNPEEKQDNGWIKFEMVSESSGVDCSFTIADCSRNITLDVSFSMDPSSCRYGRTIDQSKEKMDLLIKSLQEFRDDFDLFGADAIEKAAEYEVTLQKNKDHKEALEENAAFDELKYLTS